MTTSILTVGGTSYTQSGRKSARLIVDGWGWDVDNDYWLEFSEYAAVQTPAFTGPAAVTLTFGGTTYFTGDLISVQPTWGELGRTWGYRCLGLKYRANWIPVTATDGSGLIRFNVDISDYDDYIPSLANQTVGQIISYCLTHHSMHSPRPESRPTRRRPRACQRRRSSPARKCKSRAIAYGRQWKACLRDGLATSGS